MSLLTHKGFSIDQNVNKVKIEMTIYGGNYGKFNKISHEQKKIVLNLFPSSHVLIYRLKSLNSKLFFSPYFFYDPFLYSNLQAILPLYASGRTTGVVLDCGDGVSHIVPVYEGLSMVHAVTRIDVAGRDITNHLQLLLRRAGYVFHTSAELEVFFYH